MPQNMPVLAVHPYPSTPMAPPPSQHHVPPQTTTIAFLAARLPAVKDFFRADENRPREGWRRVERCGVKRREAGYINPIRRRRSLSRILVSRPTSGSSSHSSGPPVSRGVERPTRGNGRAIRARPVTAGPPSYTVLLRVGFTERPLSRADLVSSYLTVSPLLRARRRGAVSFLWHFPPIARGRR